MTVARRGFYRLLRAGVVALSAATVGAALVAQDRPPVVESVDLAIPFAPAIVRTAGTPVIAYEIHITNFTPADVELTRLIVMTQDGRPVADYAGDELGNRLGRADSRRRPDRPRVLPGGQRAIAYLWIELPDDMGLTDLRHRLELEVSPSNGSERTSAETTVVVPSASPVTLGPPLRGGPWTAIYDPLLVGGHRTAIYTVDARARIPGRFAIDWIKLPPNGTFEMKAASRPPDWNGNGAEVLAVADATVAAAVDDTPDNTDPPSPDAPRISLANASGNYVALDLGDGRFVFYEHLLHGSVAVKRGDRVRRGDVIGRLGNSGSSSIGPHLHFHVADRNSLLGAEGLPFVFREFQQLGAFASLDALIKGEHWRDAPARRTLERPAANAVVSFP